MSRKKKHEHLDGSKTEARAAGAPFRVVKDGRLLAGAKTEAEASRLAAYLDATVVPR